MRILLFLLLLAALPGAVDAQEHLLGAAGTGTAAPASPVLDLIQKTLPAAAGLTASPAGSEFGRSCLSVVGEEERPEGREIRWERDARSENALARWCAAVGGAVVEPEPAGDERLPAAGAGVDSLAVLSWNTHVGAGALEQLVEDLRAGRLTEGRPVRHFVLLLQEAPRAGAPVPELLPQGARAGRAYYHEPPGGERFDVVTLARRLGLALYYVPSMRNGARQEDWGNALLSTLPLAAFDAFELPFESRRRVAAAAVVEGTTTAGLPWRLRLASTHLDVWSRRGLRSTFGGGRLRQARALVGSLAMDSLPTVVGGDFNTWGLREPAITLLRQHFPDSPPPERKRTHSTTGRHLDYLFFRLPDCWTARYRRLDDRYGSDHYPLLGWVRVAGCASPPPQGPTGG